MKATEIFIPNDFPSVTYVAREELGLERKLRDALDTPGLVISISGPSKSGKTVLIERVVSADNLISITGAGITSSESLWTRVLDAIAAPVSVVTAKASESGTSASIEATGGTSVLGFAKASVTGKGGLSAKTGETVSSSIGRTGLTQVAAEIADSTYVLLIDDFHYMARASQTEIAKEIKDAAKRGIKVVTASVPHRSDDVVRGNPELRGRVQTIDLGYWSNSELRQIAELGFPKLNVNLDGTSVSLFSNESSGSPQLMQAICLQTCFEMNLREEQKGPTPINLVLTKANTDRILQDTSTKSDYSSLVRKMHIGAPTRGTERKIHLFSDGTQGDVYRGVLLALASNPASLDFPYNDLSRRLQRICEGDSPQAASIYQACSQISQFALDMYPEQRVIEWDEEQHVIHVVDPYFLFYLRWSDRLQSLAKK